MEEDEIWQPDVRNWDTIPIESFKVILENVKERFNDVLGEMQSITEKSYNIIKASLALQSFTLAAILKHANIDFFLLALFAASSISSWYLGYFLVAPKFALQKGLAGKDIRWSEYDEPEHKSYQIQLTYQMMIVTYQDAITMQQKLNSERMELFKLMLLNFIFVLILTATIVGFSLRTT